MRLRIELKVYCLMSQASLPESTSSSKRVMSGMRATGKLHLGHYVGVLKNWLVLQAQYDCFFMVADWHSLTTNYQDPSDIQAHISDMVLDWLAVGLDPQRCHLYVQSRVPEIAELHLLLSMLTPQKWLETSPTLKDMVATLSQEVHYGLLGYPVLQTADILVVRGDLVPVGKDQLAHLELSRDIVTRFNHVYKTTLFPAPKALLTEAPSLPGLDGKKMSKSLNNTLALSDTAEDTTKKLKQAITDPGRVKRTDPGNPEQCEVVFKYYQVFASAEEIALTDKECRNATRGCSDCKLRLAELINEELAPIRNRRTELEQTPSLVEGVLNQGLSQARQEAQQTLDAVRQLMHLT